MKMLYKFHISNSFRYIAKYDIEGHIGTLRSGFERRRVSIPKDKWEEVDPNIVKGCKINYFQVVDDADPKNYLYFYDLEGKLITKYLILRRLKTNSGDRIYACDGDKLLSFPSDKEGYPVNTYKEFAPRMVYFVDGINNNKVLPTSDKMAPILKEKYTEKIKELKELISMYEISIGFIKRKAPEHGCLGDIDSISLMDAKAVEAHMPCCSVEECKKAIYAAEGNLDYAIAILKTQKCIKESYDENN